MPELPIYQARNNIKANAPAPLKGAADMDLRQGEAAQGFNDIQGINKTLADTAQAWSNANDVMQATEARSKHGLAIADIQQRAERDPDFSNGPKYHEELVKAKNTTLEGISNQQVAAKLGAEFNYDSGVAAIKIQDNMRQKQIVWGQVQAKNSLDTLMQQKLQAPDAEQAIYDEKIKATIHDNVVTGILSPAQADKLLSDAQKTSVQYQIYNDPATSEQDSKVLADLKDPKGKYAFLPPDTRLDLITESQRRVFQNNQTYKRNVEDSQVVRNNNFINKMADQTATFQDIDAERAIPEEQGGIKRTVLDQYTRRLQGDVQEDLNRLLRQKGDNKKPTQVAKKAKEYNDLIEMYLDDKSDQWKAKEALAKGYADGLLDADELKILDPLKTNLKDIQFNKDTSLIATAVKQVKNWMGKSNASSEDIAIRIKQLLNSIGAGENPQVQAKKIMDAEMTKHFPEMQTYPKEGKKFLDRASGRAYVVYPDGKWAWVEGKNPEVKK